MSGCGAGARAAEARRADGAGGERDLARARREAAAREVLLAVASGDLTTADGADTAAAIELCGELGLRAAIPGLERRAFGGLLRRDRFAWHARVALARSATSAPAATSSASSTRAIAIGARSRSPPPDGRASRRRAARSRRCAATSGGPTHTRSTRHSLRSRRRRRVKLARRGSQRRPVPSLRPRRARGELFPEGERRRGGASDLDPGDHLREHARARPAHRRGLGDRVRSPRRHRAPRRRQAHARLRGDVVQRARPRHRLGRSDAAIARGPARRGGDRRGASPRRQARTSNGRDVGPRAPRDAIAWDLRFSSQGAPSWPLPFAALYRGPFPFDEDMHACARRALRRRGHRRRRAWDRRRLARHARAQLGPRHAERYAWCT